MSARVLKWSKQSIADSTAGQYQSNFDAYAAFCKEGGLPLAPPSWPTAAAFVAYLADSGTRQAKTIAGIFTGVKTSWTLRRQPMQLPHLDPEGKALFDLVMKGVKRSPLLAKPKRVRLPLGGAELKLLRAAKPAPPLWAACTMLFFGFLRGSELMYTTATGPRGELIVVSHGLMWGDLTWEKDAVVVRISRSKTDQQALGWDGRLFRTGGPLCPVEAITAVWRVTPPAWRNDHQPMFRGPGGRAWSLDHFRKLLKAAVKAAGLDPGSYNTHSFRSGAASEASRGNVPPALIGLMGRWKSDIWRTAYVQPKQAEMRKATLLLAGMGLGVGTEEEED